MKYFFITLFLILNVSAYSQENNNDSLNYGKVPPPKITTGITPFIRLSTEVFKDTIIIIDDNTEEYPEPEEFIPVEKNPSIDLKKLQSLVKFPKILGNNCIEGKVIVKILIAKNGDIVKKIIEESDCNLYNESVFEALDKYGKVEPALQNKKPIHCWLSVPITFRLR